MTDEGSMRIGRIGILAAITVGSAAARRRYRTASSAASAPTSGSAAPLAAAHTALFRHGAAPGERRFSSASWSGRRPAARS